MHFEAHPTDTALGFSMERYEARSVSYSEVEARQGSWTLRHLEEPPVKYSAEKAAILARDAFVVKEPA